MAIIALHLLIGWLLMTSKTKQHVHAKIRHPRPSSSSLFLFSFFRGDFSCLENVCAKWIYLSIRTRLGGVDGVRVD